MTKPKLIIKEGDIREKIGFEPHEKQLEIIRAYGDSSIRDIIICAGRRSGKALYIDTDILTTNGWKKMKDLNVGDYVFGEDGKPTRIEWVSDIMNNHKCYNVHFSDGSVIKADAEHLWTVENKSYRKNTARCKNTNCTLKTKTTEELSKSLKIYRTDGMYENNYSIPVCREVEFEKKELPIDPYVLGYWLGGGHSGAGTITTGDVEMVELFDKRGYELRKLSSKFVYSVYEKNKPLVNIGGAMREITIMKDLEQLGVLNNKHIPDCYMFSSIEQRYELLRGLMDSDGTCGKNGHSEFCGVNKKLCYNVFDLISSLGLKSTINEHECYLYGRYITQKYRIFLTTDKKIFNLERKYKRQKKKVAICTKRRYITDIVECSSVPVKCISVDNKSKLYLAGRTLIPTHNSLTASYLALLESFKPNRKVWIVAPTSELTRRVYDKFQEWVVKTYSAGTVRFYVRPYNRAIFPNKTIVECKTADNPASLLGEAVDLLIIDEARVLPPETYERYLYATTSSTLGKTIMVSTPMGKDWFFDKFTQAGVSPDGISIHFPSAANPHLDKEEIERARKLLPEETFRQEFLAEFLDSAATVFRNYRSCVRECFAKPKPDRKYYIGADLAKYKDFNVYAVLDRQTHEIVYIDRTQGVNWVLQKERLTQLAKQYNNARIIIDATGLGSPIVDDLKYAGLLVDPFVFTHTKKKQLIEKLIVFTEQEAVFIPPYKPLLEELSYFQKTISNSGNEIYAAPTGSFHDDCVIALALAVWPLHSVKIKKEKTNIEEELFNREKRMSKRRFQYN